MTKKNKKINTLVGSRRNNIADESGTEDSIAIYVNGERWYLYQQLSLMLGLSVPTFYGYVRTGEIQKKKVYGVTVYRR